MKNRLNSILIDPKDNVVTVTQQIAPGETIFWLQDGTEHSLISGGIPAFHKAALKDMQPGDTIIKYGEVIAQATEFIPAGWLVHVNNCTDPKRSAGGKEP